MILSGAAHSTVPSAIRIYPPPLVSTISCFALMMSFPSLLLMRISFSASSVISSPCAWISTFPLPANILMPSFCAYRLTRSPAATVNLFSALKSVCPPLVLMMLSPADCCRLFPVTCAIPSGAETSSAAFFKSVSASDSSAFCVCTSASSALAASAALRNASASDRACSSWLIAACISST